jgi:hypothetical protein
MGEPMGAQLVTHTLTHEGGLPMHPWVPLWVPPWVPMGASIGTHGLGCLHVTTHWQWVAGHCLHCGEHCTLTAAGAAGAGGAVVVVVVVVVVAVIGTDSRGTSNGSNISKAAIPARRQL